MYSIFSKKLYNSYRTLSAVLKPFPSTMKNIIFFWATFVLVFLGVVLISYQMQLTSNILIVLLFLLYYVSQIYVFIKGKNDARWIASGIFVQTVFALVSPLYFSNFGDPVYEYETATWFDRADYFYPCHLCWWARIMMFPLVPLSFLYLLFQQKSVLWYIYLISIPGVLLEGFHFLLQKPEIIGKVSLNNPFWCTDANPCAAAEVAYFGFITIPFLALLAFLLIHIFAGVLLWRTKK